MGSPGDAPADGPPAARRGTRDRGSWLSTWAGDDTRPADEQTVLKSTACGAILIVGLRPSSHPLTFFRLINSTLGPYTLSDTRSGTKGRCGEQEARSVPDLPFAQDGRGI